MRRLTLAVVVVALSGSAVPARAEQAPAPRPAPPGPPRVESGLGWRAWMFVDHVGFAASDTFDAVTGSAVATAVGGGGEVRFWKGLFARAAVSRAELDGTRGFVVTGRFISTGVPLTIEMTPVEVAAGWRFVLDRRQRYVLYGGGGLVRVGYKETSDFADPDENVDETHAGYLAFGGLDVRITRWTFAGVEGQYRSLGGAFGPDGVAGAFSEDDLGGSVVRVLFGIRR
ncbi:MAG TPA: hypothetical protein VMM93_10135 [Vicinamibacterales bacterium]|nr:hypothetical protein [Vicinamibacterales bacterium]